MKGNQLFVRVFRLGNIRKDYCKPFFLQPAILCHVYQNTRPECGKQKKVEELPSANLEQPPCHRSLIIDGIRLKMFNPEARGRYAYSVVSFR